jgi:hypothetical protein
MNASQLESLTSRCDRYDRILKALRAFEHVQYEPELANAEKDLRSALDSEPKEFPLTAPPKNT